MIRFGDLTMPTGPEPSADGSNRSVRTEMRIVAGHVLTTLPMRLSTDGECRAGNNTTKVAEGDTCSGVGHSYARLAADIEENAPADQACGSSRST